MSRNAIVTGGSRGIGATISKALQAADCAGAGNDDAAKAFTGETDIITGSTISANSGQLFS
ncbi:acetoacetyl-CoA reductase [Paracoccus alcaliphilus]|uniref:Acetoacetyl-CoA reductase n=1 Tax=Paracoccus alcaliphilus TaxID=34002 RepID=A0A1H8P8M8_9RHOB|nr:hypothetical protein JHW40_04105 [Paracoccus alcaliphilus]SEO38216.1 acetoacetyl-CoA reductase [Paracoccus alcaliphilus]